MNEITLGKVLTAKGFQIAALAQSGVDAQMLGDRIVGWGHKEPVAILIAGPEGIAAFDPEGGALDRTEVEALAPGLWALFAQKVHARDA